jgi:hypothetical protein
LDVIQPQYYPVPPTTITNDNDHNNQDGWGLESNEKDDKTVKEVVKFINRFLGVMGPFLFPLPYVLALIPFAIPAIPLSLWLESREQHKPSGN